MMAATLKTTFGDELAADSLGRWSPRFDWLRAA